jgi:hypothetical protein
MCLHTSGSSLAIQFLMEDMLGNTRQAGAVCCLFLLGLTVPAFGQVDFSGNWAPLYHEDFPERIPGPELGDYMGIPMTAN